MKYNKTNILRFLIFIFQHRATGKSFPQAIKNAYYSAFPQKLKFTKK